ncbi:unnamed protein product [Heterobilharzia americana]|nr:unnamed protein product [Heterobilharzia americana]
MSFRGTRSLMADIIASLLQGLTRDTDQKMRLLYAQWLGNLGAIDPCKLCLSNHEVKTKNDLVVFVNDRRFPFHVLCELAKIYLRAASPRQLDSAALAVQELLKLFKVPDVGKSINLLSSNINDPEDDTLSLFFGALNCGTYFLNICAICLLHFLLLEFSFSEILPVSIINTIWPVCIFFRYVVESFINWSAIRIPIITNQVNLTYESWIRLWSGSLSSHLRSEILAVFTEVTESIREGGSHINFDNLLKSVNLHEVHPSSNRLWRTWFPLGVQTIFGLLDYLRHWLRIQQEYVASKPVTKGANTVQETTKDISTPQHAIASSECVDRVSSFLSSIPDLLQAKASLRCGSLARALLHWELAYGEDTVAQQSAFVTGIAVCRSDVDHTLGFAKPTSESAGFNSILSANKPSSQKHSSKLGKTGVIALIGLLDTYASLRDSDGLAGVLSVTQLAFAAFEQEVSLDKRGDPKVRSTSVEFPHNPMQRFSLLRALELENEGQLDMAAAAYEHSLATSEFDYRCSQSKLSTKEIHDNQHLLMYSGLFRCELPDPARLHGLVERAGALVRKSKCCSSSQGSLAVWADCLNAHRAEAAWRLGNWDTLQETTNMNLLQCPWSIGIGRLFLAMKDKRTSDWSKILAQLRVDQVTELGAASLEGPGGYTRAYDTIVRLSSLSEIELINSLGEVIVNEIRNPTSCRSSEINLQNSIETTLKLLETRIRVSRPTFHTLEPVLAIRHAALQLVASTLISLDNDIRQATNREVLNSAVSRLRVALGYNWLERAKLARKSGQFMAAYTCVLRAEDFGIPDALLERAKLLWQTDKREAAQACLDKGIPEVYDCVLSNVYNKSSTVNIEVSAERKTVSAQQALLLRTRYCEETNRYDFETIGNFMNKFVALIRDTKKLIFVSHAMLIEHELKRSALNNKML